MRTSRTSELGFGKIAIVIVVALSIVVGAAVAAVASSTSGQSVISPSSAEMTQIQSTLTTWLDVSYPSLPGSVKTLSDGTTSIRYASFEALPASFVEQERQKYAEAVSQVLDPAFAKTSGYDDQVPVAFIEKQMSSKAVEDDGLPVAWDHEVMSVEYRCTLANGDVVVWLHYWVGEKRAFDVQAGIAKQMRAVDQAATDEYVLRKAGNGWRIVGFAAVDFGGDISPEYGPDTPHQHEYTYTPKEVLGWAPGQTPEPGASIMPTTSPDGSTSQ